MAVTLFCPNLKCRSILQVPDSTRGKKVRCGQCGTTFLVPHEDHSANAGLKGTGDNPPTREPT